MLSTRRPFRFLIAWTYHLGGNCRYRLRAEP